MKESTYSLLMAITLAVVGYLDSESVGSITGYVMAFGFLLTSVVCRAIERNGKEK